MISRARLLPVGVLALLLGAALLFWRPTSSAVLYSGYARADSGPLALEVIVDPPVGLPGDTLRLSVRVTNNGPLPLTPSVVLQLPRGLAADMYGLPSGATFNIQDQQIDWLPVVSPGVAVEFAIDLVVETADVLAPEQTAIAILRHQGDERQAAAPLWLGIPPLVSDVLAQQRVAVGQPIQLQADVAGPGPITTVWDLGDGRRLDLAAPEVVFPTAGRHTIALEASNPGGRVIRRFELTVLPDPVAAFRPDDDSPAIGQPVTFLNAAGGQPPLNVFWDFGDGATLLGEQQPTHTYVQGGVYRVRLTIENDFGRSEAVWDVTVGEAPIADMVVAERAAVGQPLTGQAFGDATTNRFTWDMGDGRTYEGATVSHHYRRPGDYYVTLTADNGFGRTQVGRWVRVDPGITTIFMPLAAYAAAETVAAWSADTQGAVTLDPAVGALSEVFVLDPIPFPPQMTGPEQLLAYVNAARARFELPPLPYNFELSAAAQAHALDKSRFPDNPHTGSDGTTGAERLLRNGYRGGYAGEATAWGFTDPRLAVEFWVNSDSHRPLILNRATTDIGVGYVVDFASANVWHWTAEFGLSYGAPARAVLRSLLPDGGYAALDTEVINFNWMWPLPLAAGERFVVYLVDGIELQPLGNIAQPVYGSRFVLSAEPSAATRLLSAGEATAATYEWLVRLEDGLGGILAESERRPIAIAPDPAVAQPTVAPTAAIVTATSPAPTPTATATPQPTDEPPSNEPPPPAVVTATPLPTATPQPSPTVP